jgi:hypothetical protein
MTDFESVVDASLVDDDGDFLLQLAEESAADRLTFRGPEAKAVASPLSAAVATGYGHGLGHSTNLGLPAAQLRPPSTATLAGTYT